MESHFIFCGIAKIKSNPLIPFLFVTNKMQLHLTMLFRFSESSVSVKNNETKKGQRVLV